jgi:hypothetical protein
MKAYEGVDVQIQIFLTSALVGGEFSVTSPGGFTSWERSPGTLRVGGWVDTRAVRTTWRRENSCPHRDWNSDPLVVQPIASRCNDFAIPAPSAYVILGIIIDSVLVSNCPKIYRAPSHQIVAPPHLGHHGPRLRTIRYTSLTSKHKPELSCHSASNRRDQTREPM